MEFTEKLFCDFLTELGRMGKAVQHAEEAGSEYSQNASKELAKNTQVSVDEGAACMHAALHKLEDSTDSFLQQIQDLYKETEKQGSDVFNRLNQCRVQLARMQAAEATIEKKDTYRVLGKTGNKVQKPDLESILAGSVDYAKLANNAREATLYHKDSKARQACAACYQIFRGVESVLEGEILRLRTSVYRSVEEMNRRSQEPRCSSLDTTAALWQDSLCVINDSSEVFGSVRNQSWEIYRQEVQKASDSYWSYVKRLQDDFVRTFPPEEMAAEYRRLIDLEPLTDPFVCRKNLPSDVRVGTLTYDIGALELPGETKTFLLKNYSFMYRGNKLQMPCCVSFDTEFNFLYRFNGDADRPKVIEDARNLGLRLFMMIPPGKVHFTFADPVALGSSFAMFGRLVDANDRTNEVINGQIWSSPSDIEEKLKGMTNHISTVTQRYLQGRYRNIFEYNEAAQQNAEAYQVLVVMDYPAGMSDQSLRYLEQIVNSGPKCGVFTLIFRNESQFLKINERSRPLVENVERHLRTFQYQDNGNQIVCAGLDVRKNPIQWKTFGDLTNKEQLDHVIGVLKKGIRDADKVVIDIDKVNRKQRQAQKVFGEEELPTSTQERIRIPIGIRGANEIQYLTLGGATGTQHALIGGVTGSGKSSLLHTIILQSLSQYSAQELRIYLIDFKRGVEFKIYADYELPAFEVVAIESEREFGYNVLMALEREQKVRAELFRRNRVDRIEDFRKKMDGLADSRRKVEMPRILLIMDEFQELFTDTGDEIGKESARLMERIVRQGRVFGIHMILSTQSYANVGGLSKAVYSGMAVRIVLKCSREDADMLLEGGGDAVEQISIDDPGRAIYNSEGGLQSYSSHFRVGYVEDSALREKLHAISERETAISDHRPRILLSNIEDNKYCIFNQFTMYRPDQCSSGAIYVGEPLKLTGNLKMEFTRSEKSNLLLVGPDTEKARNITSFAMLSLVINDWVRNGGEAPEEPIIYFLNYKPLRDSFFKDTPSYLAEPERLGTYIREIPVEDTQAIDEMLRTLTGMAGSEVSCTDGRDRYLFVFGWQRAEDLKRQEQQSIFGATDFGYSGFDFGNLQAAVSSEPVMSARAMMDTILRQGPARGVHTMIWQDDFEQLYTDEKGIIEFFRQRIAFDLTGEAYGRLVGDSRANQYGDSAAVYYNQRDDNLRFRPYQEPYDEWLEDICDKLKTKPDKENIDG